MYKGPLGDPISEKYILSKAWWIESFCRVKMKYIIEDENNSITLDDVVSACLYNCLVNMHKYDRKRQMTSPDVFIFWRCRQEIWKIKSRYITQQKREENKQEYLDKLKAQAKDNINPKHESNMKTMNVYEYLDELVKRVILIKSKGK